MSRLLALLNSKDVVKSLVCSLAPFMAPALVLACLDAPTSQSR